MDTITMNGTQELIEKIKNATKTIDYSNLDENQVGNLQKAFDEYIAEYGNVDNWKEPTKAIEFNPDTIKEGVRGLVKMVLIVQALLVFHGGYNIWESDRGVISVNSSGYYIYIGA